jgi:acyl-CoA thioesterase
MQFGTFGRLHPFDADIQLAGTAPHRFAATIAGRWNALGGGPLGGYLLAVCVKALEEEMSHPDPICLSAMFMRPTAEGPAELWTEPIRVGGKLASCQASLHQAGHETMRVLAIFSDFDQAGGRTLLLTKTPILTPPYGSLEPFPAGAGVEIADHVEYRTSERIGWYEGAAGGKSEVEFWMRFREARPYDAPALAFFVDAAAPIVLELGERGSKTIELTVHLRTRPAAGWLACRASTRHIMNGFHEEDFEIWDSAGLLVAQARQLAVLVQGDAPAPNTIESARAHLEA